MEEALGESRIRVVVKRLLALLLAVTVTAVLFLFRQRIAESAGVGYFGVFVVTLLSSATVVLPVPGLAAVFAVGGILNPLRVGLIAGLGDALGELTGYVAGYAGQGVIENQAVYTRFEEWMKRHGTLTIILLSLIPNPLFDLAGIAAGALRFPVTRFFLSCLLGKSIKDTMVALAGYYSLTFVERFIR
ncbi:MAG: VTT domain-containing protein [Anaerolineae bacterium]